jgi:uncharacterized membrane protein
MKPISAITMTRTGRGVLGLLICVFAATTAVAASNPLQVERELKETGIAPAGPAYWTISFGNKCSASDVFVAVCYRDTQGRWVTEGWWRIPYQSRVSMPQAKSSTIFFYVEDASGRNSVGTKNFYTVAATHSAFKYYDDGGTQGEKSAAFIEQNIRHIDTLWLTCG